MALGFAEITSQVIYSVAPSATFCLLIAAKVGLTVNERLVTFVNVYNVLGLAGLYFYFQLVI